MSFKLRYNTASQEIPLGYFLDSTDGNTEETALTIANTDIKLFKAGATTLANKNSGGGTHISNGVYYAVLDATDTNTLGPMKVFVHVSGALAVELLCEVLSTQEYDRLYTTTGQLQIGLVATGTAQSATGTTLVLAAAESFADDVLNGMTLVVYGSTQGYAQVRQIIDYTNATDTATVDTWTTTPSGTITYWVFATPPAAATGTLPAVNVTQFGGANGTFASGRPEVNTTHAAGTAWGSGAITAGSIATGAITNAKFAAGAIDAAAIAADAIGASELAADAATEIANAVLAAAAADPIDANVEQINTVPLTGDGSATPFDV